MLCGALISSRVTNASIVIIHLEELFIGLHGTIYEEYPKRASIPLPIPKRR